ncbi:non-hydrolyzing UDP-N-acetylglucosamine 2-epimerase [Psychrobacter faecalis]
MYKIMLIFGTRPEAIKMLPLYNEIIRLKQFEVLVCVTGQHRGMLDQVLNLFEVVPDFDLDIMQSSQDLTDVTTKILQGLRNLFEKIRPDLVLVHGDTATTFAASLACYFQKIKVGHIEAGLRTHDLYSPWPEEGNRRLTSVLSNLNFAPTASAKLNLLNEGFNEENIFVTGNTVIDALYFVINKIESNVNMNENLSKYFSFLDLNKKVILITGHRRENFGKGFENICSAISQLAALYPYIQFVYPMHLNPNVREPVQKYLSSKSNIFLIEPLDYLPFVYLMNNSYFILTDSGGIQEEAPALGKPVLLMRDTTERPEAVESGTVYLVGTDTKKIVNYASRLIEDNNFYFKMSLASAPYGDGKAAQAILKAINKMIFK